MWARIANQTIIERIDAPRPIRIDDTLYPHVIFTVWSVEELREIGIVPVTVIGEASTPYDILEGETLTLNQDGLGATLLRFWQPGLPPVPSEVTNFQARAALMQMPGANPGPTLFDDVNAALQAMGGASWQAWEYANTITRNGALVSQMGAAVGLTGAQLDDLFRQAATIEA